MKDGDLNEEEAKEEEEIIQKAEEDKMVAQGKIAFKKPTKRESSDKSGDGHGDPVKKKKTQQTSKKEKQKSLLSFADDEEEEEEDWPVIHFCAESQVVPDWLNDDNFCFQKVPPDLLVASL